MIKKAQMGNMLHLVIIAVVILIAALAIILMVTKTTGNVDDTTGDQINDATGGISDALSGIGKSCPGTNAACKTAGKVHSMSFKNCLVANCLNNTVYCCEKTKSVYDDGQAPGGANIPGECQTRDSCN